MRARPPRGHGVSISVGPNVGTRRERRYVDARARPDQGGPATGEWSITRPLRSIGVERYANVAECRLAAVHTFLATSLFAVSTIRSTVSPSSVKILVAGAGAESLDPKMTPRRPPSGTRTGMRGFHRDPLYSFGQNTVPVGLVLSREGSMTWHAHGERTNAIGLSFFWASSTSPTSDPLDINTTSGTPTRRIGQNVSSPCQSTCRTRISSGR